MQIEWDLRTLEFVDRSGVIRRSHGYSLLGKEEFWARLCRLLERVQAAKAMPVDLYLKDQWFRHDCDRALQLNGIDPDWLDGDGVMLTSLLFAHQDSEALLVTLNKPKQPSKPIPEGESATETDLLAALWLTEGSLEKAIAVAESMPMTELTDLLEARAKAMEPEEDRKKRKLKADTAKVLEEMAKGIAPPVPGTAPASTPIPAWLSNISPKLGVSSGE